MEELKMRRVKMEDEYGDEIKVVFMVRYLDGWVVLTKDGEIYTDVKELFNDIKKTNNDTKNK